MFLLTKKRNLFNLFNTFECVVGLLHFLCFPMTRYGDMRWIKWLIREPLKLVFDEALDLAFFFRKKSHFHSRISKGQDSLTSKLTYRHCALFYFLALLTYLLSHVFIDTHFPFINFSTNYFQPPSPLSLIPSSTFWCTVTTACLPLDHIWTNIYGGRNIWQSFNWWVNEKFDLTLFREVSWLKIIPVWDLMEYFLN